jgi:predicted dithiol-disulfide oxidoreductase (DUF899 family)
MTEDAPALPPVVDLETWRRELAALRVREKAATRELDAIAAQRRRLPMVELPDYVLEGPDGPVRLVDLFGDRRQLIVYSHMWTDGKQWQCPGCTSWTAQFTRLEFLDDYDARFVIVTQGPIDEALAYKERVGNRMDWYSTAHSPFGADMGAPPDAGFAVNVFLRDGGEGVPHVAHRRARHRAARTPPRPDRRAAVGRQEAWEDSPPGWPQHPTYEGGIGSPGIAALYGPGGSAAG